MADVLGMPLHQVAESEIGCALGAARLARLAAGAQLASLGAAGARAHASSPHRERARRCTPTRHRRWQEPRISPLSAFARSASS